MHAPSGVIGHAEGPAYTPTAPRASPAKTRQEPWSFSVYGDTLAKALDLGFSRRGRAPFSVGGERFATVAGRRRVAKAGRCGDEESARAVLGARGGRDKDGVVVEGAAAPGAAHEGRVAPRGRHLEDPVDAGPHPRAGFRGGEGPADHGDGGGVDAAGGRVRATVKAAPCREPGCPTRRTSGACGVAEQGRALREAVDSPEGA